MKVQHLIFSKINNNSLAAKILLEVGEEINYDGFYNFGRSPNALSKQSIRRLVVKGLLEQKKEGDTHLLKLTNSGFTEFLKLKLTQAKKLPKDKGCLVVFDIPQKYDSLRKTLRKFLKEHRFSPLQKSVWFSSFDSTDLLKMFFRHSSIDQWVSVFDIDLNTDL
jgi:DNA-binding transcriptional regulator PaaX